eukprot:Pgem_evm1s16383
MLRMMIEKYDTMLFQKSVMRRSGVIEDDDDYLDERDESAMEEDLQIYEEFYNEKLDNRDNDSDSNSDSNSDSDSSGSDSDSDVCSGSDSDSDVVVVI